VIVAVSDVNVGGIGGNGGAAASGGTDGGAATATAISNAKTGGPTLAISTGGNGGGGHAQTGSGGAATAIASAANGGPVSAQATGGTGTNGGAATANATAANGGLATAIATGGNFLALQPLGVQDRQAQLPLRLQLTAVLQTLPQQRREAPMLAAGFLVLQTPLHSPPRQTAIWRRRSPLPPAQAGRPRQPLRPISVT
jgi:hypothetical protein